MDSHGDKQNKLPTSNPEHHVGWIALKYCEETMSDDLVTIKIEERTLEGIRDLINDFGGISTKPRYISGIVEIIAITANLAAIITLILELKKKYNKNKGRISMSYQGFDYEGLNIEETLALTEKIASTINTNGQNR